MRGGDGVEADGHRRRGEFNAAAMLLVVDVGNTQTHFGTFDGDRLVEHWRFATVRESTADESAPSCATCSRCAGCASRT